MFFLILPFFLAELLIFTTWTHFYDFWEVLPFYFLPSLLGAVLVARTGQGLIATFRTGVVPGQLPGKALLHQGARFVGALCLIVPFFLPRVLAVFLILPGLRHLSVEFIKLYLRRRLTKGGGFSFIRFGNGFGGRFGGPFTRGGSAGPFGGPEADSRNDRGFEEARGERDARVVDITPLKISHKPVNSPSDEE